MGEGGTNQRAKTDPLPIREGKGKMGRKEGRDGPKWPAFYQNRVAEMDLNGRLSQMKLKFRVDKNEPSHADPGQRRENGEDPTADRPNSLPYYPRLWSSGAGVLSRDSLSQKRVTELHGGRDAMRGFEGRVVSFFYKFSLAGFVCLGFVFLSVSFAFLSVLLVKTPAFNFRFTFFCEFLVVDRPCPVLARQCVREKKKCVTSFQTEQLSGTCMARKLAHNEKIIHQFDYLRSPLWKT